MSNNRPYPLVIEFTGLPNSGKTTLIHNLSKILEADGLSVKVMQEDAELVPKVIPKKTWIRNVWITFGQLQSLLEISYSQEFDIIFLDRGYYDALFWAHFLFVQEVATKNQSESLLRILNEMNSTFSLLPDYLFVLDVSVEESIHRRYSMINEEMPTLTNTDFLTLYKEELDSFVEKVDTPIFYLDSTKLSIDKVLDIVYRTLKNLYNTKKG